MFIVVPGNVTAHGASGEVGYLVTVSVPVVVRFHWLHVFNVWALSPQSLPLDILMCVMMRV